MVPVYAPEMVALLDGMLELIEGRSSAPQRAQLLQAARECQKVARYRAQEQAAAVFDQPELVAICRQRHDLLQERQKLLDEIEAALASPDRLVALGRRLQEVSFQASQLGRRVEEARPAPTKLPLLQRWLAVARAVVAEKASPSLLAAQVPQLMELYHATEKKGQQFEECYPGRTTGMAEGLEDFRQGMGALAHYLEAPGRQQSLADSLSLLQSAHDRLWKSLLLMEQTREREGFSPVPLLDAFVLCARKSVAGQRPLSELVSALEAVGGFLASQRQEGERVLAGGFPCRHLVEGWQASVRPALEQAEKMIEALQNEPEAGLKKAERRLTEAFRAVQEVVRQRQAWQESAPRSFEAEPIWQDLRSAVEGWCLGVVPRSALLVCLEQARAQAQRLETELSSAPELERGPLEAALANPLKAFAEIEAAIPERDKARLAEALALLEDSFDRWLWCKDSLVRWGREATPEPENLLELVEQARARNQDLAGLRPTLELCQRVTWLASQRLAEWSSACQQPLAEDEDLAELKEGFAGDLWQLESLLEQLLSRPAATPQSQLGPQLDRLAAILAEITERQGVIESIAEMENE
ncbi:MAG: hypothetical protein KC910_09840 [Candidatus Eremiobacteraeota bacterium]|nr:hypothetical protein [Candidatus Eremiobacteraeota bacterium]